MTNEEIITRVAISRKLYTMEELQEMFENGKEIPLHTVKGWNERLGKCLVKKGEHGIETRLWKKRKDIKLRKDDGKEENKEQIIKQSFYLVKCYLFTREQMITIDK